MTISNNGKLQRYHFSHLGQQGRNVHVRAFEQGCMLFIKTLPRPRPRHVHCYFLFVVKLI